MENESHEPATPEQLDLLRRLGVRVRIQITRSVAEASIRFNQATARQLDLLRRLGYEADRPVTKTQASEMIEKYLKEREGRRPT
jgi:hypothetical protein